MTIINQHFTEETTLTLEGSPYILCWVKGEISEIPTVKPGVVLEIESGVTILMGSGRIDDEDVAPGLVNEGVIFAYGATFTYYYQDGDVGFDPSRCWESIWLRDESLSEFWDCTFEYGSNYMIDAAGEGNYHIDLFMHGGTMRSGYSDPPVGGIWFSPLSGSLNIDGTHFSALTDNSIVVQDGGPTVELNISACLIEDGSQRGIIIGNGIVSIADCQFICNAYDDITISDNGPESIIISNNYFDGGGKSEYPIIMTARSKVNQEADEPGNIFFNYAEGYLYANVQHDIPDTYHAYWGNVGLTYLVSASWLAENASLTIAPGQSIVLSDDGFLSSGDFTALGTDEAPIRFSGTAGIIQGYGNLVIEHCIFNGAGCGIRGYSPRDMDMAGAVSLAVRNCYFTNIEEDAVRLEGNNYNAVIEDSSFINNKGHALVLEGSAEPEERFASSFIRIIHSIIAGNAEESSLPYAGAVLGICNAVLENCTIVSNRGYGIYALEGSKPSFKNCIIWDNSIYDEERYEIEVNYSCIDTTDKELARFGGNGNINKNPLFFDALNHDYHLKSTSGRWDPLVENWAIDDESSPCIDMGDPESAYMNEPEPNNERINQGAYGNSIYASKSGETADLSISKTAELDPISVGFNLSYTLSITNHGPDSASNVRVVDLLPWSVQFVSFACSQGTYSKTGDTLSCELGSLAKDETAQAVIEVIPTTDGKITNTASVSSTAFDPDSSNNSVIQNTSVIPTGTTVGDWHHRDAGTSQMLRGICYGDEIFVAVGDLDHGVLCSEDGLNWDRRETPAEVLNDLAFGEGQFVGVGGAGNIISSPNAVDWDIDDFGIPAVSPPTLEAIAYDKDSFVAVGSGGSIFTADPVAMEWIPRESGTAEVFHDLSCGDDIFIAVGENATISTSADGIEWSTRRLERSTSNDLWSVAYGKERFVAVGNDGKIFSSADSIEWVDESSGTDDDLRKVFYADGIFVAVGLGGELLTSPDGRDWHRDDSATINALWGIGYGDGRFMAVGEEGTILQSDSLFTRPSLRLSKNAGPARVTAGSELRYKIDIENDDKTQAANVRVIDQLPASVNYLSASSTQGSCSEHDGVVECELGSLKKNTSATVSINVTPTLAGTISNTVMARGANTDPVESSLDTTVFPASPLDRWHSRNTPIPVDKLKSIIYGDDLFLAVGSNGTILSSEYGVEWSNVDSTISTCLNAVSYLNGLFLAAGDDGVILTSPDGLNWTQKHSNPGNHLHAISYGAGNYIVVGDSGRVYRSVDGNEWSSSSVTTSDLRGISRGNNLFLAAGTEGSILSSTDGSEWTAESSGSARDLNSVAFGKERFAVVGDEGTVLRSHNGDDWTEIESGIDKSLFSIAYGNETFIATASIYSSDDASSWTERYLETDEILYGVAYGNRTFVTVGNAGIILQSDPLPQLVSRGINLFK